MLSKTRKELRSCERIEELARESAKSLFLIDAMGAVKSGAHGPPSLPTEDAYFTQLD